MAIRNDLSLLEQLTLAKGDRDSFQEESGRRGLRIAALEGDLAMKRAESAELRNKLLAMDAELAALRANPRQDAVNLWYSIPDNHPLRCEGGDGEFVELWMDGGKLIMEDEREYRLEFQIGNTIALCRTGSGRVT